MRELCPRRTRPVSLCEALDRVLNTGVVALGEVTLSVADVDLIYLGLQLVVTSIESGRGLAPLDAGPPPGPLPGGRPRLLPAGPTPSSQPSTPPPAAASPPPLAGRTGPLSSSQPGEKDEEIASAFAGAKSDAEKNGLGKLVLTLMKVLHELLKRQALRRIQAGALAPAQMERLGAALLNQAREIERLRQDFGLPEEELNLDLGPLGKLL
ncbi:MAG TPA: gas vesicle protein GvpJ [Candidatus Acidoferrum sp.]|nr:gas vesicle protein GvpJ [Candidatus Acidoferrum sp.]